MDNTIKACRDCAHCVIDPLGNYQCDNPVVTAGGHTDYYTGQVHRMTVMIDEARRDFLLCGHSGRYWVGKKRP
jgi:hypothetical protein